MADEKEPIKLSEMGCRILGILMAEQKTKKGGYILSVAAGDTMYKIHSSMPGAAIMSRYHGQMKGFQNDLFFEGARL
jgi:hypothetical protein